MTEINNLRDIGLRRNGIFQKHWRGSILSLDDSIVPSENSDLG